MAYPAISNLAETTTVLGQTHAIALPGSMTNGNLCVVAFGHGIVETPGLTNFSSWTQVHAAQFALANNTGFGGVYMCEVSGGTVPGAAGGTITATTTTNCRVTAAAFEVSGWYGGALADGTNYGVDVLATNATGNTAPPSPTVTADWGLDDNLFLCIGFFENLATGELNGNPFNYVPVSTQYAPLSTSACTSVYSYSGSQKASDAQGSWSTTVARDSLVVGVVIRPASAGGTSRGQPFGNRSTAFNGGRTFVGPIY
jgi:hypothetical protein